MRNPSWPGLDVEVQKCVCKFGCESCARLRDMTIGQDLRYYPCFVHSCEGIPFHGPDQMQRALARGKQRFAAYARKYGRNSPTLIRQDEYLKERWEVFFEIPALFEKCEKLLMRQGFHRGQIRAFTLHYCRPRRPSAEWTQFRRVLKFGSDEHTPNKVEFIDSEHEYRRQGPYLLNLQRFKEAAQPPSCKAERTPQKQIAKKGLKGFEIYMTRRFEVHDFEKGAIKLCLDKAGGKVNLKISLKNLNEPLIRNALRDLGARPIRIPFTKWSLYNASQTQ
jgi:hypothetical protein